MTRYLVPCSLALILLSGCTESDPSPPPAAQTNVRERRELPESLAYAEAFALEHIQDRPGVMWGWIDMVEYYAFWQLYEAGGNPELLAHIEAFVEDNYAAYQPIASDWFSPAVLDLLVCTETKAQDNCERVASYDDYFMISRREQGALVHWTAADDVNRQIWVDTIFMVGAYMLERARHLEGKAANAWWDDLVLQFTVLDKYLTDPATDLMHHGYDFAVDPPLMNEAGAYWGRGNGWYVAMLGSTLRQLPADHPGRVTLASIWHSRVTALLRLQDARGFWHTLLDDPDAYPEASATALFAAGIAAGLSAGLVHDGAAQAVARAMEGLNASIAVSEGRHQLPDISGATVPGSADSYREVETRANIAYGVGAYILAALEYARLRGEITP